MSYTLMNGFFQTPNVWKQTWEVQKLELVASEFICTLTKRSISLTVSSGLFPSTLYDPTPTHPILAPLLPTPHFLSHQVMTSGFELGSLRVLFSEFSPPSSGISPILGLQQRSQGACLISSRSIFISPSHSPSLRKIQTARFSFKVKNWQSP